MIAPPQFDAEHSRRWVDRDAAENYRFRAPYPPETFDILDSLIVELPRAVLDIGCGTGNIARLLAPRVERVDAVDLSPAMIEVGRTLPGGDDRRIRWQVSAAEEANLDPPYAMVVGAASLHWMAWHVVLPRFAEALTPRGMLVVAGVRAVEPEPWTEALNAIIQRHSTYRDYVPFDMLPAWEEAGLFEMEGEANTAPIPHEQSIEEFILGWHAASNLTRAHIDHHTFDAEVRALMAVHCPSGTVRRRVFAELAWGRPLPARP